MRAEPDAGSAMTFSLWSLAAVPALIVIFLTALYGLNDVQIRKLRQLARGQGLVELALTNRDATLVLKGDKLGLISTAIDIEPVKDDRILLGGVPYNFIDLQPLSPGGQVLLYEFHARR